MLLDLSLIGLLHFIVDLSKDIIIRNGLVIQRLLLAPLLLLFPFAAYAVPESPEQFKKVDKSQTILSFQVYF